MIQFSAIINKSCYICTELKRGSVYPMKKRLAVFLAVFLTLIFLGCQKTPVPSYAPSLRPAPPEFSSSTTIVPVEPIAM